MKLRVRSPTGKEICYKANPWDVRNLINGWTFRAGYQVTCYEDKKNKEMLLIIERKPEDGTGKSGTPT